MTTITHKWQHCLPDGGILESHSFSRRVRQEDYQQMFPELGLSGLPNRTRKDEAIMHTCIKAKDSWCLRAPDSVTERRITPEHQSSTACYDLNWESQSNISTILFYSEQSHPPRFKGRDIDAFLQWEKLSCKKSMWGERHCGRHLWKLQVATGQVL